MPFALPCINLNSRLKPYTPQTQTLHSMDSIWSIITNVYNTKSWPFNLHINLNLKCITQIMFCYTFYIAVNSFYNHFHFSSILITFLFVSHFLVTIHFSKKYHSFESLSHSLVIAQNILDLLPLKKIWH